MALDITRLENAIAAAVEAQMDIVFDEAADGVNSGFATALSVALATAIIDEIKNNADLTDVTSGGDTVAGGVD